MNEMDSMFLIHFVLPAMDLLQNPDCILTLEALQRIKPVTEFCQTDRNHGHALKDRCIFRKLLQAVFQFFSVVDSFAQNDLPVHDDPRFIKLVYFLEGISRKTVVQHFAAKLRIHCLKGNVDR